MSPRRIHDWHRVGWLCRLVLGVGIRLMHRAVPRLDTGRCPGAQALERQREVEYRGASWPPSEGDMGCPPARPQGPCPPRSQDLPGLRAGSERRADKGGQRPVWCVPPRCPRSRSPGCPAGSSGRRWPGPPRGHHMRACGRGRPALPTAQKCAHHRGCVSNLNQLPTLEGKKGTRFFLFLFLRNFDRLGQLCPHPRWLQLARAERPLPGCPPHSRLPPLPSECGRGRVPRGTRPA